MRLREREMPLDPEVERELEAIDRALAGEPVDPDLEPLAELARALSEERVDTEPGFAADLDQQVADGFPRPGRLPGPTGRAAEKLTAVPPRRILARPEPRPRCWWSPACDRPERRDLGWRRRELQHAAGAGPARASAGSPRRGGRAAGARRRAGRGVTARPSELAPNLPARENELVSTPPSFLELPPRESRCKAQGRPARRPGPVDLPGALPRPRPTASSTWYTTTAATFFARASPGATPTRPGRGWDTRASTLRSPLGSFPPPWATSPTWATSSREPTGAWTSRAGSCPPRSGSPRSRRRARTCCASSPKP